MNEIEQEHAWGVAMSCRSSQGLQRQFLQSLSDEHRLGRVGTMKPFESSWRVPAESSDLLRVFKTAEAQKAKNKNCADLSYH